MARRKTLTDQDILRRARPVFPRRGDDRTDGLASWLASMLHRRAGRGEVRTDLPPQKLAALLLAALIGDAAERFVRRQHGDPLDEGLVETMLHLLDAKGR